MFDAYEVRFHNLNFIKQLLSDGDPLGKTLFRPKSLVFRDVVRSWEQAISCVVSL